MHLKALPIAVQVEYKDGSQHEEWLPLERVQVRLQAQEALEQSDSDSLAAWGLQLQHAASNLPDDIASAGAACLLSNCSSVMQRLCVTTLSCRQALNIVPLQCISCHTEGMPVWPGHD